MAIDAHSTPAPTVQPFGLRAVGDCRFLTEAEVLALVGENPEAEPNRILPAPRAFAVPHVGHEGRTTTVPPLECMAATTMPLARHGVAPTGEPVSSVASMACPDIGTETGRTGEPDFALPEFGDRKSVSISEHLPAPLPSVTAAFSRRRAIFGAVKCGDIPTDDASTLEASDLALAQMRHARRALEGALEHGAALLAALGLPRLVQPDFVAIDPAAAGDAIVAAVAALDAMDSPFDDIEDGHDAEHDTSDVELDLGWNETVSQLALGTPTDDGDATALERAGRGFIRSGYDDADGNDAESEDYENGSDDGEDIGHFASDARFTLQPITEAQREEIAVLMNRVATIRRVLHV